MRTDSLFKAEVRKASVGFDPMSGMINVEWRFEVEDALKWAEFTAANIGKHVATEIDGVFMFAPRVNQQISSGACAISSVPNNALLGEMVVTGAIAVKKEINHYLDLKVTDEKGNVIDRDNLYIERVWIDEDGEEDSELLSPEYFDEKHQCRLFWDYDYGLQEEDGNPLKEATLRIEVEGYDDPVTIKVKYPKSNAKKTIKFKHKKK